MSSGGVQVREAHVRDMDPLLCLLFSYLCDCIRLNHLFETLPLFLRIHIEQLPLDSRRALVSRKLGGQSPLFMACVHRQLDTVKYLVDVCGADVNQLGEIESHMTPLWYAAQNGNLPLVTLLVRRGAHLNLGSSTGSSPLAIACTHGHHPIAVYLVNNGADPCKPDDFGFSPLMLSLSHRDLAQFLLEEGVDVQAQNACADTALHLACRHSNGPVAKMLIRYGADPWIKNMFGDDALQTACIAGSHVIFKHLLATFSYSWERIANAYELIGASQPEYFEGFTDHRIHLWTVALEIRHRHGVEKKTMPSKAPFMGVTECRTFEELDRLARDLGTLEAHSILVYERILGPLHRDSIQKLEKYVPVCLCIEAFNRDKPYCFSLYNYLLELLIQKHGLIHSDVNYRVNATFYWYVEKYHSEKLQEEVGFTNVTRFIRILNSHLKDAFEPSLFEEEEYHFDNVIKILTGLLAILHVYPKTFEEQQQAALVCREVIQTEVCNSRGDSFLHVMLGHSVITQLILECGPGRAKCIETMLRCGADIECQNLNLDTPLHIACMPKNFKTEIVNVLLQHGAHLDCKNGKGELCYSMLKTRGYDCKIMNFITLQCLSARTLVNHRVSYKCKIPNRLERFVEMH